MPQIGQFSRLRGLFTGRIATLTLDAHLVLVPTHQADHSSQPHYAIHLKDANGPEVGAGWKKVSERAGDYISIQIDCPGLPAPLTANLFQQNLDKKVWVLLWNRQGKRDEAVQ